MSRKRVCEHCGGPMEIVCRAASGWKAWRCVNANRQLRADIAHQRREAIERFGEHLDWVEYPVLEDMEATG